MQSASHSLPRLIRLLVKPGMTCPVRACIVGMVGIANRAEADDVVASPVAVRMVAFGALVLTFRRGARAVK